MFLVAYDAFVQESPMKRRLYETVIKGLQTFRNFWHVLKNRAASPKENADVFGAVFLKNPVNRYTQVFK